MALSKATGTLSVDELNQRLHRDEEWLRDFQDALGKSNALAGSVCRLLDSFEERIDSLSANVATLYAKSSVIQREQQSIRKLLSTVDATIQFHGKTTALENTIRDGNVLLALDDYLEKMRTLKEAIAFFSTHLTYKNQLEHLKQIYEIGCANVEAEFGNLVKCSGVPVDSTKLFDCLDEDYEMPSFRMGSFLTLRDAQKIHQMAGWLLEHTECSQFLQFYAQCRAENMLKPLRNIGDQIGQNNRAKDGKFVKAQKPDSWPGPQFGHAAALLNGEKWRKVLRYGRSPNRKSENPQIVMVGRQMDGKKAKSAESGGRNGGEEKNEEMLPSIVRKCRNTKKNEENKEKSGESGQIGGEKKTLAKLVEKSQRQMVQSQPSQGHEEFGAQLDRLGARQFAPIAFRLFALKRAAHRIADSNEQVQRDNAIAVVLFLLSTILVLIQLETELCSTVFANVRVEADVLRQIVGACLGRVLGQALRVVDAYEGSFPVLLPLARFMLRHANQLASLSENVGESAQFASLQSALFRKSVQLIQEYRERLANDQIGGRFVPEDGNVHPVSSGTLNLLKVLVQQQKLLTQLIQRADCPESPGRLAVQILIALGQNLRHKSSAYSDPALGSLFMFNNLQYIAQTLGRDKNLHSLLVQTDSHHPGQSSLAGQFEAEAEGYLQRFLEGWTKIGAIFGVELESGDERKVVRSIFTNFTREFDSIVEQQKNFCLADQTMAARVRTRIKLLVLRPFVEFSKRNSQICAELFETDRQLKYDAETVEMIIDRLFDATL